MNTFIGQIKKILLEYENLNNESIIGINYLEKIKHFIINDLKKLEKSKLENLLLDVQNKNIQSEQVEINDSILTISINFFKDSFSKIKSSCSDDSLFIVINGFKTVSIFELNKKNTIGLMVISKYQGIVVSKNTVLSENIASDSVILDIVSSKKILNVEY